MSSVHAVTEDIVLEVRVASFYEFNDATRKEILEEVSKLMHELGKKHNFLVWRTRLDIPAKENT